jgi:hypothetical protein
MSAGTALVDRRGQEGSGLAMIGVRLEAPYDAQTAAALAQRLLPFLAHLETTPPDRLGLLVALVAHQRNRFLAQGINVLDPKAAVTADPELLLWINLAISEMGERQPAVADAARIWLFTLQGSLIEWLATPVGYLWRELRRGLPFYRLGASEAFRLLGVEPELTEPWLVPRGVRIGED